MRLVGFAYAGVDPELMGIGPVPATERVLEQAGLSIDDIGLFELNEPFAVQVLSWCDGMGVSPEDERLNPYGGAIACGHPLAATGVRLMAQLAYGLRERPNVRYGLTALCIGMGMGAARALGEHACLTPTFLLNRLETAAGPLALVTMDNGEDRTKPTVLGRQRVRVGASASLGELESGDWVAMVLTGKPFVFCAGADIDEFPQRSVARGGDRGQPRRARPVRPHPRAAVPDGRRDQRRVPRRRRRDRAPLRRAHDRKLGPPFRVARVLPRDHPRLGRDAARPAARRRARPPSASIVENPLRQNRMLRRGEALELGLRRPPARAGRVPRRVDRATRSSSSSRPLERAAADLADVGRGRAAAPARSSTHRSTAPRPAPYRALDLIEGAARWTLEEGYRAEEEAVADLLSAPPGAGLALRVRPRRAAREAEAGIPTPSRAGSSKVGVVGAGLMARQLAALFAPPARGAARASATSTRSVVDARSPIGERARRRRRRAGRSTRARRASSARSSPARPATRASRTATSCSRRSSRRWA